MGCAQSKSKGADSDNNQNEVLKVGTQRRRLSIGGELQKNEQPPSDDENEDADAPRKLTEKSILDMIDSLNKVIEKGQKEGENGDSPQGQSRQVKRRISIGSETDKELNKRHSFKKKDESRFGDVVLEKEEVAAGFSCRKGLKPESPNQDSFCILVNEGDFAFYGVFDGHGARGHDVSQFVKENLPKLVIESMLNSQKKGEKGGFRGLDCEEIMKESFLKIQSMVESHNKKGILNAQLSGTTCTFVIRDLIKQRLVVSHVGDSRAVLVCRKPVVGGSEMETPEGDLQTIDLTIDHKPDLPEEREYIERNGGRVVFDGFANHRVYVRNGTYPGLNMSRALGDVLGSNHAGINNEPDVVVYCLRTGRKLSKDERAKQDSEGEVGGDGAQKYAATPTLPPLMGGDKVTRMQLMICSDGVWEFITSQAAKDLVSKYGRAKSKEASEALAKQAWDSWIREEGGLVVDDITALVVYI